MDPITLIVSAIALGAGAGLKDSAAAAVKDAYAALKDLMGRRYRDVSVAELERRPDSAAKRASLQEDLTEAGAASDPELLEAARTVVSEVRRHDAGAAPALGIDLERVQAEFLRVRGVESSGAGVRVHEGTFSGGIDIENVRAGGEAANPP